MVNRANWRSLFLNNMIIWRSTDRGLPLLSLARLPLGAGLPDSRSQYESFFLQISFHSVITIREGESPYCQPGALRLSVSCMVEVGIEAFQGYFLPKEWHPLGEQLCSCALIKGENPPEPINLGGPVNRTHAIDCLHTRHMSTTLQSFLTNFSLMKIGSIALGLSFLYFRH